MGTKGGTMRRIWGLTAVLVFATSGASPALGGTPRQETENTLRNGATAQESYRTSHDGYTERTRDLRSEGLRWERDRMTFYVSWAATSGYCLRAKHVRMERPMHYDSFDGRPRSGRCPASGAATTRWREQVDSVLKDAATAQESYATSHEGRYTNDVDRLRAEGWRKRHREIRFRIVRATRTVYCMEARHYGVGVFHYSSTRGRPLAGGCPTQ